MLSARLNRSSPVISAGEGAAETQTTDRLQGWTETIVLFPCPPVDQSLIDYLKRQFPITLSRSKDLRDYDAMRGALEVIRHLEAKHKEQNP